MLGGYSEKKICRAGRCARYIKFWNVMLLKIPIFLHFPPKISKKHFCVILIFSKFIFNNYRILWTWEKNLHDLRTKGTNYETLKNFFFNFDEIFVIFPDFFFKKKTRAQSARRCIILILKNFEVFCMWKKIFTWVTYKRHKLWNFEKKSQNLMKN